MTKYNHKKIEKKIQEKWANASRSRINAERTRVNAEKIQRSSASVQQTSATSADKPKYYILDMFPYPSGDGLHMGHTESYTASDIMYRYKRLQGFDVLHPQGFDSFGLPAENYAIKTGVHPKKTTKTNADNYIQQMKMLGLGHDLNHMVYTSDQSYYKWTQWIFGKFFENDLVEQKTSKINWCPSCNTGIANEQVESGKCERCKTEIEQREIPGWFFKITDFADDLINDLDKVDWPEHTKKNQRNWIGKSVGAKISFEVIAKNKVGNNSNVNAKDSQRFSQNNAEQTQNNNEISNIIMVHGCADNERDLEYSKKQWQPWIKEKLEHENIKVHFPTMPNSLNPVYEDYKKEFEKINIDEKSVLIGHSCGSNFLVKWLSENNIKIKKLILVAPWNEPEHNNKTKAAFYNISNVDYNFKRNIDNGTIIFTSNDEEEIGRRTAKLWTKKLGANLIELEKHGHYTEGAMGTTEFPELLEEILRTVNRKLRTSVEVFTTRPDTLFGVTYLVVAPEHELVVTLLESKDLGFKNYEEVKKYIEKAKNKTEMDRMEAKEKTGVRLEGLVGINPANGEEIPIFVADYVLGGYGTGAIMAVPAHDERDYAFASQINAELTQKDAEENKNQLIKIRQVIVTCENDKDNPPQKGLKEVSRDTVIVHLRDKSTGRFAILNWHNSLEGITTAIMGGIEKGQTPEQAALAEISEEAALENVKIIKKGEWITAAKYCASHKGENRMAISHAFLAEIDSLDQQGEIAEEEKKIHTLAWVDEGKVESSLTPKHQKQVWNILREKKALDGKGLLTNSGKFDGMDSEEAKKAITEFVGGEMTTNYRLRDWSISRQRYWGCPIPIVYSPEGEAKFVGEENLPWLLPEDVDFVPDGTAPLAKSKELKERTEKLFGKGWTPEVDTMDTFVDSSWYFLRYPDTKNEKEFCSPEKLKRWLPVDLYIGGAEHTYMHLLFARFFVKAMHKMDLIEFDEPFLKLRHQGMVLDKNGVKMSKSKGNVVNPNDMVEMFGADATRMYMMFAAPLEDEVAFKQEGVKGVFRFLEKVWRLAQEKDLIDCGAGRCGDVPKEIPPVLHKTIKKVGEDIENLSYNTAIAQMMIFVNEATKHKVLPKGAFKKFLIILSPFAPHITEELWGQLGEEDSIFNQTWPEYNPEMIQDKTIELVVQVNGKVRDKIEVAADVSEDEAREKALASEKIKNYTDGKEIRKIIFVPGRLVNVVI